MTTRKLGIVIVLVFAAAFSRCAKAGTIITPVGKLLIDTDAGGDDAVAILMAVDAEELKNGPKIVGITCVNGNTDVNNVAMNVLKTLKVVDRLDIPVYAGASHPLLLPNKKDYHFGKDGFGDFDYPDPPSMDLIHQKHAVNAMIELVNTHPNEVTLLALGPLTNVALAIRMYPSFLDKLQQLVVMGGSTAGVGNVGPGIEFNFYADPAASYVVLNSPTSATAILVPEETVLKSKVTMKFRTWLSRSNNNKVWLIDSAATKSLKPEDEYWYCADAVTMAVALTSGSIVTKSGTYYSEIIYEGSETSGLVIVDYTNITGYPANTKIIQRIDDNVYKKLLFRSFGNRKTFRFQ